MCKIFNKTALIRYDNRLYNTRRIFGLDRVSNYGNIRVACYIGYVCARHDAYGFPFAPVRVRAFADISPL